MNNIQSVLNKVNLTTITPIILALSTVAFYFSSLTYPFIFDDLPTITNYPHIRFFNLWSQLFTTSRWISRLLNQFCYYHWNTNPMGYRILNLSIHITIGLMIFFIILLVFRDLKKNKWLKDHAYLLATMTSGLFLLHPVQTQTATYITQMQLEGLVALVVFSALLTFILAAKAQKSVTQIIFYALSFMITFFGIGTKENIVVLSALIALFDWFFIAEGDWKSFKSRLLVHATYTLITFGLLVRFNVFKHSINLLAGPLANNRGNILTNVASETITSSWYFMSQFKVVLHYLTIFFWPFNISFDYDVRLSQSILSLDVLFPLTTLLLIIGIGLQQFLKNRANIISFCIAWFFIAIAPRASFFPSTELICDYKTYLSSFGTLLLLAYIFTYMITVAIDFLSTHHQELTQASLAGLLLLGFGMSTQTRNLVWSSDLNFWLDATTKAPKARGFNNLGTAYLHAGNRDKATSALKKSIELDDFYAEPHINLAMIYQNQKHNEKAMQHYKRAIEIGEGHPELFNNLGLLHLGEKRYVQAEHCFKLSLKLRSHYSTAYLNLGHTYQAQRKFDDALESYHNALKHTENTTGAHYYLGKTYLETSNFDKAIEHLEKIDNTVQDTAFLLGCSYYQKHNYKKAADNFALLHKHKPENTTCNYNLAQSFLNIGKYEEALPLFESCKKDSDNFPYAELHVIKCLKLIGQKEKAHEQLAALLKETKHDFVKRDGLVLMEEFKNA